MQTQCIVNYFLYNLVVYRVSLAVLSGKELFSYNAALFVDDESALDQSDEQQMNLETQRRIAMEEQKAKEEEERIKAEQQRLFELQMLEIEERKRRDAERKARAEAPDHPTFVLAGVVINEIVFEEEDVEDLAPFPEETFVEIERKEGVYATEQTTDQDYVETNEDEEDNEDNNNSDDGEDVDDDGEDGENEDTDDDGDQEG